MKRNVGGILCFLTMVAIISLIGAGPVTSEEVCIELETITLIAPDDVEAQRSSVDFPHGDHFDYTCKECHHTWDYKTPVTGCTASGCHDSSTPLITTKPEQAYRYYKNAYHDMCISCHKKIKASNKKLEMSRKELDSPLPETGPVGCIGCHPKY